MAAAAVAEFLEECAEYDQDDLDHRYEEIRAEIRRRQARPMSESLSPEQVEKAIDDAMNALDFRDEVRRRKARPMSETVSPDEAFERAKAAVKALNLPERMSR